MPKKELYCSNGAAGIVVGFKGKPMIVGLKNAKIDTWTSDEIKTVIKVKNLNTLNQGIDERAHTSLINWFKKNYNNNIYPELKGIT